MKADDPDRLIDLAREPALQLGQLEVRPATREVVVAGAPALVLEPRVMQVLVALARRRGAVVSRDDLIAECWGGRVVGEDAINRCIQAIRKLADTHGGFRIFTIARVGYRLERAQAQDDAALVETTPALADATDSVAARAKPRIGKWTWAIALIALSAATGAGAWLLRDRIAAPSAGLPDRVAVLPLDTLGSAQDIRGFADGLMDELLGVLSTDRVQTISRTEGAALRSANSGEVIQRLGIGLLLDGSVGEADGAIKVRLHLDDPARSAVIWSEDFDRPASEADALQAEVAAKAARVITEALGARAAGVSDPATVSDFVTGDEHSRFDPVGFAAADPFYRRVIARAPWFAGGHSALAIGDAFQSYFPGNPRAQEQRAEAAREAQAALRLDPKGDNAFIALSMLTLPSDDYWRVREAPLHKGMALNPNEPAYPDFLAPIFAEEGRLQAAAESEGRAVALDPYWPGATSRLANYLRQVGQADESQRLAERMQRLWPGLWATNATRFWTAALEGDPAVAVALLEDPRTRLQYLDSQTVEVWRTSLLAMKSGRPEARAAAASAARTAAAAGRLAPAVAVLLLVQLGDVDGAFAVAERSPWQVELYDLAGPPVLFIAQTAPLRRDPRFMRLAAKLGLVRYWRASGNWPDFCAEPGLPYDCKAEAARLASTRPV
jgi:DNA-binding winged helix-turn-helix (wHTH) protein/TolB-like protein/tetratricopeptide (TPR) repeat protein